MGFKFENTEAYKRAVEFCDKVLFLAEGLEGENKFPVGRLGRAVLDIPLNVAEGAEGNCEYERRGHYLAARRSCFKCIPLLGLLVRNGQIGRLTHAALKADLESLAKMLTALAEGDRV